MSRRIAKLCALIRERLGAVEAWAFRWLFVIFVHEEFTPVESKEGNYAEPAEGPKNSYVLEPGSSTPVALAIAQAEYDEINARLATVTAKIGSLQTVAGIVVSSTTAIVAIAGLPPGWSFKLVLALFLALIVLTVF